MLVRVRVATTRWHWEGEHSGAGSCNSVDRDRVAQELAPGTAPGARLARCGMALRVILPVASLPRGFARVVHPDWIGLGVFQIRIVWWSGFSSR